MKSGFLDKLIERLDQVEPEEVQRLIMRLVREKGFLESVFESLQEGVFILDPVGQITFVNQAAVRIFGLQDPQCVGQKLDQVVRGLNWAKLADPSHIVSRDMEILYPERRFLNVYLSPMRGLMDDDAQHLGYVLLVRDLTTIREQEEKVVESEKLNALTLLAAGVAHEIGNPLNSLDIHLQLLRRKLDKLDILESEDLGQHLDTAQEEIKRLDTILKQFLQAIRPTTPERESHNLHTLLKETLDLLAGELESRKVKVSLALADSLPSVQLDSAQIKQALFNLIKNAFQALPASGGLIEIETAFTDYEISLVIRDHGSGIPPEVMGSIFEPFHSTKKSGTGLGLLIVRRIIREHGGEIELESQQGEGTSVSIFLPRENKNIRLLENISSDVIEVDDLAQTKE